GRGLTAGRRVACPEQDRITGLRDRACDLEADALVGARHEGDWRGRRRHRVLRQLIRWLPSLPNGSRFSCGPLKKDLFLYLRAPAAFKRSLGRPTTRSDADRREHGRYYLLIRAVYGYDVGKANRKATTRPEDSSTG